MANTCARTMEYAHLRFTAMTVLEEMYCPRSIEANLQKFSRNRAKTPPDAYSVSSADFSSSTRPLDPAAPAKYQYKNGSSPPRHSPRGAHLSKPTRVPSGPRVAPPNFGNMKSINREERYSRPSFTASDYTRPTSGETDDITAVIGNAVRTDIRTRTGTISPNWVRTRRVQEEVKG